MTPEQQRILEAGYYLVGLSNKPTAQWLSTGCYDATYGESSLAKCLDQAQTEIDQYKQALEYVYRARTLSACKNLAGKVLQK